MDYKSEQVYVFFDEIQYLREWEVHLKSDNAITFAWFPGFTVNMLMRVSVDLPSSIIAIWPPFKPGYADELPRNESDDDQDPGNSPQDCMLPIFGGQEGNCHDRVNAHEQ